MQDIQLFDFAGQGYTQYEAFTYEKGNTTGMHNNFKWTQSLFTICLLKTALNQHLSI